MVFAEAGVAGDPVPSGVAALLIALVPLLVVLMRAGTGDRPRLATVAGVVVGFGGLVALVAAGSGVDGSVPLLGSLIVVGAAASWAVGSFVSSRLPLPADPFVATVYESLVGGAVIARRSAWPPASGSRPAEVSTRSWLALLYLLVAGSLIAFTAYAWLLQNAPISLTSTYAYVNPAVAVLLGALIVAEPVTPAILVGGLIIVVGVALVVSTERRAVEGRADAVPPIGSLAGRAGCRRRVARGRGRRSGDAAGRGPVRGTGPLVGCGCWSARWPAPRWAGGSARRWRWRCGSWCWRWASRWRRSTSARTGCPTRWCCRRWRVAAVVAAAAGVGPCAARPARLLVAAYGVLAVLPRSGLGFGDVKLAGLLGVALGLLGWGAVAWGTALAFVLGGVVALVLLADRPGRAGDTASRSARPCWRRAWLAAVAPA